MTVIAGADMLATRRFDYKSTPSGPQLTVLRPTYSITCESTAKMMGFDL